ncbi:hypothetical protein [Nonomuraea dietziae]|uniref:hypothetical protein n=1 Tax=Nonomuraea dietziae TaxID=65515 RepID=UPI0034297E7A
MYEVEARGRCVSWGAWSRFWRKLISSRKAKIYAELELELVYQPSQRKVPITARSDQRHIGEDFVSEDVLNRSPTFLSGGERWLDLDRVN